MDNESENPETSSANLLHSVQPLRDLESNWTVDLAKNLEEYLLKICSGEISGNDDALSTVNFAEAALLLQGSVQVYSRKVEYLYSLVLHALEFLSQKSQEDTTASTSAQQDKTDSNTAKDEDNDPFWVSDDIPVEAKNSLDSSNCKDVSPSHFVRPPANLVVLEGDCLDSTGEAGELESYLLATNDLYRDFILLDSCDAVAVDNFLDSNAGKGQSNFYRGSSITSKRSKNFLSPSRRSGGTGCKLSARKKQEGVSIQSPCADHGFEFNQHDDMGSFSPDHDLPQDQNGFEMDDSDDDDDPWEPLNPHEPGNMKVKPYRKVKAKTTVWVGSRNNLSLAAEFPHAKLNGPIRVELNEIWEAEFGSSENGDSKPLSVYEKLRQSLTTVEEKTNDAFHNPNDPTEDNGYDSEDPDPGPPDDTFMNDDVPPDEEKRDDGDNHFGTNDTHDEPEAATLEDLCRSHLDSLLASLSETETQNELARRVSSWKQRIEENLEEQDSRPPFDIHKYGEVVLDKLSVESDSGNALSFGDVVKGQEKHDVARTFSALLQLVNNGDVDLVKNNTNGKLICHSNANPFFVQLLRKERREGIHLPKKRAKTPLTKGHTRIKKGKENSTGSAGKASGVRCTPEGKKRRKSRIVVSLDMHFAG